MTKLLLVFVRMKKQNVWHLVVYKSTRFFSLQLGGISNGKAIFHHRVLFSIFYILFAILRSVRTSVTLLPSLLIVNLVCDITPTLAFSPCCRSDIIAHEIVPPTIQ